MHRHEKKVVWCVVLLFNGLALHFGLSIVGINLFAELLGFVFVRNSG
jgi:hypothetical protein